MLMYLGRGCVEDEMRISIPGAADRCYELRILRSHQGPLYRLGLTGRPCTQVAGYAVLEALRWLGVKREVLRKALEAAVAELTLRQHDYFCQGRALLGSEHGDRVDQTKDERSTPLSVFAMVPEDPVLRASEPPKP